MLLAPETTAPPSHLAPERLKSLVQVATGAAVVVGEAEAVSSGMSLRRKSFPSPVVLTVMMWYSSMYPGFEPAKIQSMERTNPTMAKAMGIAAMGFMMEVVSIDWYESVYVLDIRKGEDILGGAANDGSKVSMSENKV